MYLKDILSHSNILLLEYSLKKKLEKTIVKIDSTFFKETFHY